MQPPCAVRGYSTRQSHLGGSLGMSLQCCARDRCSTRATQHLLSKTRAELLDRPPPPTHTHNTNTQPNDLNPLPPNHGHTTVTLGRVLGDEPAGGQQQEWQAIFHRR